MTRNEPIGHHCRLASSDVFWGFTSASFSVLERRVGTQVLAGLRPGEAAASTPAPGATARSLLTDLSASVSRQDVRSRHLLRGRIPLARLHPVRLLRRTAPGRYRARFVKTDPLLETGSLSPNLSSDADLGDAARAPPVSSPEREPRQLVHERDSGLRVI